MSKNFITQEDFIPEVYRWECPECGEYNRHEVSMYDHNRIPGSAECYMCESKFTVKKDVIFNE